MEQNKRLPKLCDDNNCTGCLACVNACNNGALSIHANQEGFYRPLLDADKCVRCGLCEKSCPVINKPVANSSTSLEVFAAWHLDDNVRRQSSSGGAFTALAENILNKGGVVFGAAYDENMRIEHIAVEKADGLKALRLSKYAQSYIGETFKEVNKLLRKGRVVMYVGTPCQIAGLKKYLRKDYENLLAVDIICHGVPSMLFLQSYLTWVEGKYGKIEHINFRDKRKGWYDALRVVKTAIGGEKVLKGDNDNYWVGFSNNNNLQYSCYKCQFQAFPRVSDMTIADFWGIGKTKPFGHKKEIERGVSMIVVNNPAKKHYLDIPKDRMYIEHRSLEEAKLGNSTALKESHCPASRATIYSDLKTMDYDAFSVKYLSASSKQKLVKIFREYLPSGIVKYIRLRNQK